MYDSASHPGPDFTDQICSCAARSAESGRLTPPACVTRCLGGHGAIPSHTPPPPLLPPLLPPPPPPPPRWRTFVKEARRRRE